MALAFLIAPPRWWFPQAISGHARDFDHQFEITLWVIGLIFLAGQALLAFTVFRFRDRGQQASATTGNRRMEIIWTSATAVLFLGLAIAGQGIWANVHLREPASPLRIEVMAKQFAWSYRYPGPDGKYGGTALKDVDDASGNPFGIDSRDPAGRDDITTATLRVPAGQPIELQLKSRDVIHNFFVRELRIKQDVVPGMTIPLRFTATKTGTYEIPCSELCGLGHHQMRSVLTVMTPADFDDWLREQQQPKINLP